MKHLKILLKDTWKSALIFNCTLLLITFILWGILGVEYYFFKWIAFGIGFACVLSLILFLTLTLFINEKQN